MRMSFWSTVAICAALAACEGPGTPPLSQSERDRAQTLQSELQVRCGEELLLCKGGFAVDQNGVVFRIDTGFAVGAYTIHVHNLVVNEGLEYDRFRASFRDVFLYGDYGWDLAALTHARQYVAEPPYPNPLQLPPA